MATLVRVLARMLVRRVVTAARRATLLARAKVQPARARLHALVALALRRELDVRDGRDVFAGYVRHLDGSWVGAARAASHISGSEIDFAVMTSVRPGSINA